MELYTMRNWEQDGTFKAKSGQQIEEQIYWQMLNGILPKDLPYNEKTKNFDSGFLMGEADTHKVINGKLKAIYLAFGCRDNKYYYIGKMARN